LISSSIIEKIPVALRSRRSKVGWLSSNYHKVESQSYKKVKQNLNFDDRDAFFGIFLLFHQEDVVVEMELELFVAIVDTN
jgi:hypothetical protein